MAQQKQSQRCPNCGAMNRHGAKQCVICDTPLVKSNRPARQRTTRSRVSAPNGTYNSAYGEDDLMIRGLNNSVLGAISAVVLFALLVAAAIGVYLFIQDEEQGGGVTVEATRVTPTDTLRPTVLPTNTRPAPLPFPTVTPMPATETPTPLPGPCERTAKAGDTVYGLAQTCGHRHLSIVDVIVEENPGLSCSTCLKEGQTILIPWPTATPGGDTGAVVPAEGADTDSGDTVVVANDTQPDVILNEFGTPDVVATYFVEPTLRPGLMWYVVQDGDNLITIASQHSADAKIISDINPEIEFQQCDFSAKYGGDKCVVIFVPGQRVRVPAPTSTPTIPPTPSGSETPTPTATATFNVPSAYSPPDGANFDSNSLVTLRWSSTGSVAANEAYLVTVTNLDTDTIYQGLTQDLLWVIPDEWQPPRDRTQDFEWSVSIATLNENGGIVETRRPTTPRQFSWQGK
ncbi:MAG: LysM peptidoglycan-binding domain-containing protein [Anaerolineales bacterium]|nr:LysM peptidoglycan-binding domain-containing protein [Anaerolineales bacterium]